MIAPDDITFDYLAGREHAPKGAEWDQAVARWRTLASDPGATYDHTITLDASALEPMITFGTNPGMGMASAGGSLTLPASLTPTRSRARQGIALHGPAARPGLAGTESRCGVHRQLHQLAHLRPARGGLAAAGRKVAGNVRVMVVPGSQVIKQQAEAEGLDQVFKAAGAEWREPGCSMCIAMNGDQLQPGQYAVSTSNRNFEGRQGQGGRTFLASPLTAAASALAGAVADPRTVAGDR
ncbi:aconitase family protein [Candidatus Accumulibacter necessarius]|jgi:3-isopropylmalate/(R)-2-methylmalate dehydratase large subunit|uniref:aconitase family protein n=1 Tax=Candidatus Accumulibacter necessarius TaxID=2954386 RepID=UPI003DA9C4FE